MYGLIVLTALAVYCLLCYGFVRLIASIPKGKTKRRIYGWSAFLVYNSVLIYQFVIGGFIVAYGCYTDAGFELYKTPEQWQLENPGVAETLTRIPNAENQTDLQIADNHRQRIFHLNQRFNWVIDMQQAAPHVVRVDEKVVDIKTGEVMARRIDYKQQGIAFLGGGVGRGCIGITPRSWWVYENEALYSVKIKFQDIMEDAL